MILDDSGFGDKISDNSLLKSIIYTTKESVVFAK